MKPAQMLVDLRIGGQTMQGVTLPEATCLAHVILSFLVGLSNPKYNCTGSWDRQGETEVSLDREAKR